MKKKNSNLIQLFNTVNSLLANKKTVVSKLAGESDLEELIYIYEKAKEIFEELNIDDKLGDIKAVLFKPNMSNAVACCRRLGNGYFQIEFSDKIFNTLNDNGKLSTMMHELIHTIDDCFNHGKVFKHYAQMLTNHTGIKVSTHDNKEDYDETAQRFHTMENFKYVIQSRPVRDA